MGPSCDLPVAEGVVFNKDERRQKQLGFLPNLLSGLSNSPATLASYVELSKHFAKVGLTGIEMQTVLVVTSVENACPYCVAATRPSPPT